MKRMITRLLFNQQPVVQYLTCRINCAGIQEKAYLISNGKKTDVSKHQYIFCQYPFIMGIWIDHVPLSKKLQLEITNSFEKKLVAIHLIRESVINLPSGYLLLCRITWSHFSFIHFLHQKALIAFFYWKRKSKARFYELDCFCATYLFPRKVILVCAGQKNDYNVFPMDLQGYIPECNTFMLGLRNTNVTLQRMLTSRHLVVCEIGADKKDIIYALGRHHSTKPPRLNEFPFGFSESPNYGIPVPEIVTSFREVEIQEHRNLGTHTLMVCKVEQSEIKSQQSESLYHVHVAAAIKKIVNYPVA